MPRAYACCAHSFFCGGGGVLLIIFALLFSLPPINSRTSDPGSHSGLFLLPAAVRASHLHGPFRGLLQALVLTWLPQKQPVRSYTVQSSAVRSAVVRSHIVQSTLVRSTIVWPSIVWSTAVARYDQPY